MSIYLFMYIYHMHMLYTCIYICTHRICRYSSTSSLCWDLILFQIAINTKWRNRICVYAHSTRYMYKYIYALIWKCQAKRAMYIFLSVCNVFIRVYVFMYMYTYLCIIVYTYNRDPRTINNRQKEDDPSYILAPLVQQWVVVSILYTYLDVRYIYVHTYIHIHIEYIYSYLQISIIKNLYICI